MPQKPTSDDKGKADKQIKPTNAFGGGFKIPPVLKKRKYRRAEALRHPKSRATQIPRETRPGNPTLAHRTRKDGAPVGPESVGVLLLPDSRVHCRVQHVGQKVYGYVGQANRQDASLNEIVVAVGYGLDG